MALIYSRLNRYRYLVFGLLLSVVGVAMLWPTVRMNLAQVAVLRALFSHPPASLPQEWPQQDAGSAYAGQEALFYIRLAVAEGKMEEAARLTDQLAPADFAYRAGHSLIAQAFWEEGETETAVAHWEQARKNLHLYAVGLEAYESEAFELATMAWEAASRNWQAYGYLGWTEEKAAAEAYGRLAVIYNRRGALEEAVSWYRRRLDLTGDDANVFAKVADLYRRLREYEEAQVWLARGLAMDRQNALLHYHQGQLWTDLGEPQRAIASYNRALRYAEDEQLMTAVRQRLAELNAGR